MASKTAALSTQAHEFVKTYTAYDGVSRPATIYTAPTDLDDGGICSKVQYEYINATSFKVSKMKESSDVWDATWDL